MSSLSGSNVAQVLHLESLRDTDQAAAAAETHDSSYRLRFNSLALDELSDELDRRTKETQRLQEEVENATKDALEKFGCRYGLSTSPGQSCNKHGFNVYNPAGDSTIFPPHTQGVTQHVDSGLDILNQEVVQRRISSPGENVLENAVDDSSDQLPGLQLRKTHDQTEQGTFGVDKAIVDLQTKLHEAQMAKGMLSDLRVKDSRNHVDQMEKMLCMLEELQNIKRATDQKLQDTENEALALSGKVETLEQIMKEIESGVKNTVEKTSKKKRSEELIASICQEMALLTDQLSSSKLNSVRLSVKLEHLKNLTERQTSLHQCRASEDKSGCGQQQCQLQVEVKALRGGLEEAKEQLHKVGEEEDCSQAQDQRSQTLHIEGETLRLKLDDREKLIDILQLQLENSAQVKVQHINTIDSLHQKNFLLSNQLNQHKLEIQQLRAEVDQHKSDLAAAEHEKLHLQASVAEQSQRVREESLEKRQISSQLEIQRMQLLALRKEHEELRRLHSCKSGEQEGVVLRLQSQLRDTHDELDQVRITLRTLEGADGHGLRVALDMQKEITARREQVDSLQSKIQHLEETVEKLHQERRHQSRENKRQLGALTFVREEKKQLSTELEALRSKDQQLRDRISQLEAILHKISESFADCQDFIQLQEQQFYRMKLRHVLDLKELQGPNLHSTPLNLSPPNLDSQNPSELSAPPSAQHGSDSQIKASPSQQLRSLVKELRGVISENLRPHTDNGPAGSIHRRRSAPEREHRTTFSTGEAERVKANSRMRKPCSSETHFLTKAELTGKMTNKDSFSDKITAHPGRLAPSPAAAVKYTSWPQFLSLGRRSPVHSLLTSDPHS